MVQGRDLVADQAHGPVLVRAAAMVRDPSTGMAGPAVEAAASRLLRHLGYDSPQTRAHRAALLLTAASFRRLFQLVCEHAPGLVFVGAEIGGGVSASGVGATLQAAFEGCVGEAAEYLSQVERQGDVGLRAPLRTQGTAFAASLDPRHAEALDWVRAHRLSDGGAAWVPADLCLRRPTAGARRDGYGPLSVGCAAGVTLPAAILHGLLEAVERDAVCRWRRGRPLASPYPAARLLAGIRQDVVSRATWLLDITTELRVPCIAAVSCGQDGRAVAVGSACRPTVAAAARSALMEMCQMELAAELAPARPDATPLGPLRPQGPPAATVDLPPADAAGTLRHVAGRLARRGAEAFVVELTRAKLAIPVAHVLCPALRRAPA